MTPNTCPICGKELVTDTNYTSHMNIVHQEMTQAQKEFWHKSLEESKQRRSPYRAALEAMVGKEVQDGN